MRRLRGVVIAALLLAAPATAASRVALVVGNAAYQHVQALKNPVNDEKLIAARLRSLGFEVIEGRNLDKAAFEADLRSFAAKANGAEAAVLYYAGHGVQVAGRNWLVPVDADIRNERMLGVSAIDLEEAVEVMKGAANAIVFLDACRDNPFAGLADATSRGVAVGRGLAPVVHGDLGTFVAYAAQPGAAASDGTGEHSYFAAALDETLPTPGIGLNEILIRVRNKVVEATGNKQVPWQDSSLRQEFYFVIVLPSPPSGTSQTEVRIFTPTVQFAVEQARKAEKTARSMSEGARLVQIKAREAARLARLGYAGYVVWDGTNDQNNDMHYEGKKAKDGGWNGRFGLIRWKGGQLYEREFVQNDTKNLGVYTFPAGEYYEGEFMYAKFVGAGVYHCSASSLCVEFAGQWSDSLNGYAVAYWKDGTESLGSWKNGVLEGYGAKVDAQGNVIEQGYYENGKLKTAMRP